MYLFKVSESCTQIRTPKSVMKIMCRYPEETSGRTRTPFEWEFKLEVRLFAWGVRCATLEGDWCPTFLDSLMVSSSGIEMSKWKMPEQVDAWMLSHCVTCHPVTRRHISTAPLQRPNNSHFYHCFTFCCSVTCNRLVLSSLHPRIISFN
jgi:hypothetical protein